MNDVANVPRIGRRSGRRQHWTGIATLTASLFLGWEAAPATAQPFMANAVKIGEVTSTSAMIWTRLTATPDRNLSGLPFQAGEVDIWSRRPNETSADPFWGQVPEGASLAQMLNAVPGSAGLVRLAHWKQGDTERTTTDWIAVEPGEDFAHQFELSGLEPGSTYGFNVEASAVAGGGVTSSLHSAFTTAPAAKDPARIVFTVITGADWETMDHPDGQKIYPHMAALKPDFFVHTGDVVYYDHRDPYVSHMDLARFRWHRMYATPRLRAFHQQVATYFMRDDHDTWQNDGWPGMPNEMGHFTLAQGQAVFREQTPMSPKTYRTVRWGKDLQVWFTEGRDYRSPNPMPDGPDKTIWGKEQMAWFKNTVTASDATFRILVSPTPIVGPDHVGKLDNHSNLNFAYEGDILRRFLSDLDMIVVCGDRHWQYASKDPKTGLLEYGSGSTTDAHAANPQNEDLSMIKYVKGIGGFLSVTIEREDEVPRALFRHHDIRGTVMNEDVQSR
jgi:alkaline phosphatase D